jgi:hypothetical protein
MSKPLTIQKLEEIVSTLSNDEKEELMTAVRRVNKYLDAPVSKVDEAVLDAKVDRANVGGKTSLRSTIAWLDSNLDDIEKGHAGA